MKTNLVNRLLRRAMPVGACAGLAFLSHAQDKPAEPQSPATPKPVPARPAKPAPEKVPFLGLALGSVDESLAAQLGLPKGVGVLVRAVMPDSPADKAGVLQHDILRYFNDQMLVNEAQLQSLVRAAGIGSDVTLKLLRKGKEETLTVKLGEHEERETAGAPSWRGRTPGDQWPGPFGNMRPPGDSRMFNFPLNGDAFANRVRELSERMKRLEGKPEQMQEEIERFQKEMQEFSNERRDARDRNAGPPRNGPQWRPGNSAASSSSTRVWKDDKGGIRVEVTTEPDDDKPAGGASSSVTATADGEGKVIVTQNNSTRMAWNDGDGSGELVIENGKKKLSVKDVDGKQIFKGPIDTEEQMKSLPPRIRERVEGMQEKIKVESRPTGRPAGEIQD